MSEVPFRALPSNTKPTHKVLAALLAGHTYGSKIQEVTGLQSGTVYPILTRLEVHGWVTSQWEPREHQNTQPRPTRRYFVFTEAGERAARELCRAEQPR